jgi:type II secretory pathway pseudopilin PulG
MNIRMFRPVMLIASAAAIVLASVASAASKVRVDKADVDLAHCQSFAWHAQTESAASFTDQRVRDAVMTTLKAKGYTEVTDNPDCRVSYSFSSHETSGRSRPSVGVGVGGGSGGIGGGLGIGLPIGRKKEAATLTIDVIDSAKNAQIWSGSLEGTVKSSELSDGEAKSLVSKVLAEYPDRVAKKE